MIGTRGVPARYGGFETAVEEVGKRLVERGHDVTVFCRGISRTSDYLGMRLIHLPAIRHKMVETVSHTAFSVLHKEARAADAALIFNAANSPFIPILRSAGVPVAVHVDGLEWRRSKWGRIGRSYYLTAEKLAVRWADRLIADARGIQEYYRAQHGREAVFIPYGAPVLGASSPAKLSEFQLKPSQYHLVVARMEPENHIDVALDAYLRCETSNPLVIVGDAPYADRYRRKIFERAEGSRHVRMLGSVWDQEALNTLYAHALTYVHGHSVGGTNPSLLRAMGAGAVVLAYDVNFNREVAGDTALYWRNAGDLATLFQLVRLAPEDARSRGQAGQQRVAVRYRWEAVTDDYESLCRSLLRGRALPNTEHAPC